MKKPILKECIAKLSDENLDYLYDRFGQKLSGDLSQSLELLSKIPELDKWLCSAQSSTEFFEMVDQISDQVLKEGNKRFSEKKDKKVTANN